MPKDDKSKLKNYTDTVSVMDYHDKKQEEYDANPINKIKEVILAIIIGGVFLFGAYATITGITFTQMVILCLNGIIIMALGRHLKK